MYVSDLLILTENMLGSLKKVIILDPVTLGQGQIIQYGHQKEKYFIFLDTKACESHKKNSEGYKINRYYGKDYYLFGKKRN